MAKTKPLSNYKFRIFVDGSFDDKVNIGTIAYHMQNNVDLNNKIVNIGIHNKTLAKRVYGCKHSLDAEIQAVELGFNVFDKIIHTQPILKKVPVRVKSDSVPVIKYITQGKWKDDVDFDDSLLDNLNLLKSKYESIREEYPNFKLSYIPSKKNLAHHNAYEMLKWERGVNNE